jgi:hypothetical protein
MPRLYHRPPAVKRNLPGPSVATFLRLGQKQGVQVPFPRQSAPPPSDLFSSASTIAVRLPGLRAF